MKRFLVPLLIASVFAFLPACEDDGDDDNQVSCSDAICTSQCQESNTVEEWGLVTGTCDISGQCKCNTYPCHNDPCSEWCISEGNQGGTCDPFNCVCN